MSEYLFGPGSSDVRCLALSPECMGWIPYLLWQATSRFGS